MNNTNTTKSEGELRCPGRVSSCCSTYDTHHDTLVKLIVVWLIGILFIKWCLSFHKESLLWKQISCEENDKQVYISYNKSNYLKEVCIYFSSHHIKIVSKWLLFNAKWSIFQLCNGEITLIYDDMMIVPAWWAIT